jgi:hypothetical protein
VKAPRLFVIGIDALRPDLMADLASGPIRPRFFKDGTNDRARIVQTVQTTWPSITHTALGSFLDGKPPSHTQVRCENFVRLNALNMGFLTFRVGDGFLPWPFNDWVNVNRRHFCLAGGANSRWRDVGNVLFAGLTNRVSTSATLAGGGFSAVTANQKKGSWFTTGFPYRLKGGLTVPSPPAGLNLEGMILLWVRNDSWEIGRAIDQAVIDAYVLWKDQPEEHRLIWLPGFDIMAHQAPPDPLAFTEYVQTETSQAFFRIIDTIPAVDLERTYFVAFGDHGMTEMGPPENVITLKMVQKVMQGSGYTIFDDPDSWEDRTSGTLDDLNMVVTFNDQMIDLFVRRQGGLWSAPPTRAEVLAVAERFRLANLPSAPKNFRGKIDFILVREATGADGWTAPYEVYTGPGTTQPIAAWAAANPRPQYVTNWVSHVQQASHRQSGDVVLVVRFDQIRFTTYKSYHGHGGLTPKEMEAGLAVGYLGAAKAFRDALLQRVDARRTQLAGAQKLNIENVDLFILTDLLDIAVQK